MCSFTVNSEIPYKYIMYFLLFLCVAAQKFLCPYVFFPSEFSVARVVHELYNSCRPSVILLKFYSAAFA